jgi:hypothetical protein
MGTVPFTDILRATLGGARTTGLVPDGASTELPMKPKLTLKKETLHRLSADTRGGGQGFPGQAQTAGAHERNLPSSLTTHLTTTWG